MVFKLVMAAVEDLAPAEGRKPVALVVEGVKFTDGVAIDDAETRAA
jgi:hypothetical protein